LALETIDLNGSETLYSLANKFDLKTIFPSKVSIWKTRCKNPMRKSFNNINIKIEEIEALIKITSEMSKYLYPYIRAIISSQDNYAKSPQLWNDFQSRYIDLIGERFNKESILVKKLIDQDYSRDFYKNILLNLALSISKEGYSRLKITLLNL
tara:strand:- start:79 stop:537 length:459 start_codon:yes stop_codon:yes gene_type:complete